MSRAKNDRNTVRFGPAPASVESEVRKLRREQQQAEFRLTQGGLLLPDPTVPVTPPVSVPGDLNTALAAGFPYLLNQLGDVYATLTQAPHPNEVVLNTGSQTGLLGIMVRGVNSVKFVDFPSGEVTSIAASSGAHTVARPFFLGNNLIIPGAGFSIYNLSTGLYSSVNDFTYNITRSVFPLGNLIYRLRTSNPGSPGGITSVEQYDLELNQQSTGSLTYTSPSGVTSSLAGRTSGGAVYNESVAWASVGYSSGRTGTHILRIPADNPLSPQVFAEMLPPGLVERGYVDDQNRLVCMNYNVVSGLWEIVRYGSSGVKSTLPLVFSGNPSDQPNFFSVRPSFLGTVPGDYSILENNTNAFCGISPGPDNGYFIYGGIVQDFGEVSFSDGLPVLVSIPAIWYTNGTTTQRVWTLPDSEEFPLNLLGVRAATSHLPQQPFSPAGPTYREHRLACSVSHLTYSPVSRQITFVVRVGALAATSATTAVDFGSESRLYRVQL